MRDALRYLPPELRRAALQITVGSILFGALCGAVSAVIEDHRRTKTLLTPKE
jgi:hypothetical protein